jgi:hypothetical protein
MSGENSETRANSGAGFPQTVHMVAAGIVFQGPCVLRKILYNNNGGAADNMELFSALAATGTPVELTAPASTGFTVDFPFGWYSEIGFYVKGLTADNTANFWIEPLRA